MNWLLLEYERDREHVVCRNMTRLGIIYYHPEEIREVRPFRNSPKSKSVLKSFPLIAGTMFLLGGIETARKALTTQYTEHVACDVFEKPLEIPTYQIERFREAVLEWNETVRKGWETGQPLPPREKQKFVPMTRELLANLFAKRPPVT